MAKALEYVTKVHPTRDKKKLASGKTKDYEYGAINIRAPELREYVGKKVKVKIEKA